MARAPGPSEDDALALELRRQVLDHAAVVRAGETLVVLGHENWNPSQMYEVQRRIDDLAAANGLGFRVMFIPGSGLAVGRGGRTLADFQGFRRDCGHRLELLPVIEPRFDYQCIRCGGQLHIVWTEQTSGTSPDSLEKLAYIELGRLQSTPLPDEVTNATADHSVADRDFRAAQQ